MTLSLRPGTAVLTGIAMIAFAGNSLLCRMALAEGAIDADSFTLVRLLSGAATLAAILWLREGRKVRLTADGSWRSAIALVVYAVSFSYAYQSLSAATGALILFGCVQGTMIVSGLLAGERPGCLESSGWLMAAVGLGALLLPGASAPSPSGAVLMAVSGVGWGLYSLHGRNETRPLAATTGNFLRVLLPCVMLLPLAVMRFDAGAYGVFLGVLAGSITTGIGYIVWYAALPGLSALQAALVQLSVPAIAALGGVVLLDEPLTMRLLACGLLILGGISLSLGGKLTAKSNEAPEI